MRVLQMISVAMSGFALGFSLHSLYLSLRTNRRLLEENARLCLRVVRLQEEIAHLQRLLDSQEESGT